MSARKCHRQPVPGLAALAWWLAAGLWLAGCQESRDPPPATTSSAPPDSREADVPAPLALSRQQVESRVAAIQRQVPLRPADPRLRHEWENLNFQVRKIRYVLGAYASSDSVLQLLTRSVGEAEQCLSVVTTSNLLPRVCGEREEAFWSANDGSFQPFVRYWPRSSPGRRPLPLVVFLHGYAPGLDIANWCQLPKTLLEYAETEQVAVLAPFGRSNTDFQGIGEQDVFDAITAMQERYPIDAERIVLAGYSMGGMGAYTIAAHQPDFFAGALVISGRGDYYFWKKVTREALPSYKRDLVDADFGYSRLESLARVPLMVFHGKLDPLVPIAEARHMTDALMKAGSRLAYTELEDSHWIAESVFERSDVRRWLGRQRCATPGKLRPASEYASSPAGPIKRAFLAPFVFVCAADPADRDGVARFQAIAAEWHRFAKAPPRVAMEGRITPQGLASFNVFVFGEPERSALARTILDGSPVSVRDKEFVVGNRTFPREGSGLYVVRRSPWDPARLAVVQCGLRWGEGLPDNHKYDFLPDYIIYSGDRDPDDGSNAALCAGFFDQDWNLDPARMYVRPTRALP